MVPFGLLECGAAYPPNPSLGVLITRRTELRGLASRRGPRAPVLANGLRLSIVVPSQDLSGAWVTFRG
jgi:hypothetical protein